MRAVLIVNHAATTTGPRARDVLVRALGSETKIDLAETQRRGHAVDLAAQARADRMDLVVALGGDGTVNEVVNGLLRDGPGPDVPALAVVPGGSTNVFARAIGMPGSPVEATGVLLDALRDGRRRTIGLGRANDRWFTFAAGIGLDAEVVRRVESARVGGAPSSHALYVRSTLRQFFFTTQRRRPRLTLQRPGHEPVEGLHMAIVANTTPWTYLGERPLVVTPMASFDSGLDVLGLRTLRTASTARHGAQVLSRSGRGPRGRHVVALHDEAAVTLVAKEPVACQVDGEAIGELASLSCVAVPRALTVMT